MFGETDQNIQGCEEVNRFAHSANAQTTYEWIGGKLSQIFPECGQSQANLHTTYEVMGPQSRFFFQRYCGRVPESAARIPQTLKPLSSG